MGDLPTSEEVISRIRVMKMREWQRGYNSGMKDAINALKQGLTIEEIERHVKS